MMSVAGRQPHLRRLPSARNKGPTQLLSLSAGTNPSVLASLFCTRHISNRCTFASPPAVSWTDERHFRSSHVRSPVGGSSRAIETVMGRTKMSLAPPPRPVRRE